MITYLILIILGFWLLPSSVSAQELVFSEDFSGGLEKWEPTRDDGSYWAVVDGRVEGTINRYSTISELVPKDAYWNPEWQDFSYEFDFTPITGVDRNISFGVQDLCNWYETHFVQEVVHLVRLKDCSLPFRVSYPHTLINGQTYHFKIVLIQGRIQILINTVLILDEKDWTFNQNYGKIGLKVGTGAVFPTKVAYDNIQVRLLASNDRRLQLLKQNSPEWATTEYDSAQKWSTSPTISRWGCALTSLVMIFRYHGLINMPDGLPLTPLTLNQWLTSQPDGYLGEGLLNWAAAMRLTRLISDQYQTPKIEYQSWVGSSLTSAITQIEKKQPVILQIEGHFLAADGLTPDKSDLLIKDPAYVLEKFSQHQKPLLSTRTFTPSQTDLSYFVLAFNTPLSVSLQIENNSNPLEFQSVTEGITDPFENNSESTAIETITLPKPAHADYLLTLSQPQLARFRLQLFVYDPAGNVIELTQTGWVGPRPQQYRLSYFPNQQTPSLLPILSWSDFHQDVHAVKKDQGFACWAIYWLLDLTIHWAELDPTLHGQEAVRLVSLELSAYRHWIQPDFYRYLQHQLNKIRRLQQLV